MSSPNQMTPAEATKKINQIAVQGSVRFSKHCRLDSMPDAHVTDIDVLAVLANGSVKQVADWDLQNNNWKYRVEGFVTDGDALIAIVVVFDASFSILVITVF